MLATQVILCATIIGNAALLIMVIRERASSVRVTFSLYVACIFVWSCAIYLNLFLQSLFIEQCIFASAAGVLTLQLRFALMYPEGHMPKSIVARLGLFLGLLFILLSFYPGALFSSITIHEEGYTLLDTGPASSLYSLFALTYVCIPIYIFARKWRLEKNRLIAQQLRFITVGFACFAVIAVLTNSILPVFFHIYTLNAIGPSFSLLFAAAIFYVIRKHDFLSIRRSVQRGAIYSVLLAVLIAVYGISLFIGERYFETIQRGPLTDDLLEQLSAAAITLIGVFSIPILERYFRKVTDRLFFKDRYTYAAATEALSRILFETTDPAELTRNVSKILADILRAESVEVLLYDKYDPGLRARYAERIVSGEVMIEPIVVDAKVIGVIVVSEMRSGDVYVSEDAQLLRTFSLQASTAFARAHLFMRVSHHASELETKVEERTAELKRMHERERQMLFDIAHGLQTPLTVFHSRLENLRRERSIPDTQELQQPISALTKFVQDLLKLAHAEYQTDMVFVRLSLSELMRSICEEIQIICDSAQITATTSIDDDLMVRGDEEQLKVALMNILSNSVKYVRPTGPRTIQLLLKKHGRYAVIMINDTGVGIAQTELDHIFDRFYRASTTASIYGSGLGLSITKKILERHSGEISITSTAGHGTSVKILLPIDPDTEGAT